MRAYLFEINDLRCVVIGDGYRKAKSEAYNCLIRNKSVTGIGKRTLFTSLRGKMIRGAVVDGLKKGVFEGSYEEGVKRYFYPKSVKDIENVEELKSDPDKVLGKYVGKLKPFKEIVKLYNTAYMHKHYIEFILENEGKEVICNLTSSGLYTHGIFGLSVEYFEKVNPVVVGTYQPDRGTCYNYIGCCFDTDKYFNTDSNMNNIMIDVGNAFKSEEDCGEAANRLKRYLLEVSWSIQNDNGFKYKFGSECWYLRKFSNGLKVIKYDTVNAYQDTIVYYSSRDKAEQCLQWLKSKGVE